MKKENGGGISSDRGSARIDIGNRTETSTSKSRRAVAWRCVWLHITLHRRKVVSSTKYSFPFSLDSTCRSKDSFKAAPSNEELVDLQQMRSQISMLSQIWAFIRTGRCSKEATLTIARRPP